jgi:hypothetical protein
LNGSPEFLRIDDKVKVLQSLALETDRWRTPTTTCYNTTLLSITPVDIFLSDQGHVGGSIVHDDATDRACVTPATAVSAAFGDNSHQPETPFERHCTNAKGYRQCAAPVAPDQLGVNALNSQDVEW